MKILLILLFTMTILLFSCNYAIVGKDELQSTLEEAYFEGQRDAINDDVRIKLNNDSYYVWIKSPWDSNRKPIFNPTYLNTK